MIFERTPAGELKTTEDEKERRKGLRSTYKTGETKRMDGSSENA